MAWIISGILLIIIIVLIVNRSKQLAIDRAEAASYQKELEQLKALKKDLTLDINALHDTIEENNKKIKSIKDELTEVELQYNNAMRDRTAELDEYIRIQKDKKQKDLNQYFEVAWKDKEKEVELRYANLIDRYESYQREAAERADCATRASNEIIDEAFERATNAIEGAKEEEERFQAILAPLQQYEKDKQERLFYTIQVPDEYKEDIEFLLTTVAAKVQHPDVINKLVWSEYVKPYIDGTFKRVGIKDEPGIYKLTSLVDGKCYIGKSTNIKKRISDHYKSVVGISTIADQAVHHAIAKDGYWNWTIEPVIYCEKDRLNELEKYYIDFFKSNSFGYNRTKGGEG